MNGVSADPDRVDTSGECPDCGAVGYPTRCGLICPNCQTEWSAMPRFQGVCVDPVPCTFLKDGTPLHLAARLNNGPCPYRVSWWDGASGENVCVTKDGRWFSRARGYVPGPWQEFKQEADSTL